MSLLSIVVPLHNEQENLPELHRVLSQAISGLPGHDWEIILVDDGSTDDSFRVIQELAEKDARVHYIQFSRNFGKELATTAGIHAALGRAVIMMDADLQHPPELMGEFIRKWEAGAEVVIGIRRSNTREGLVKRLGSKLFYFLSNLISETRIISQATDYRLMDRAVVDEFNKFSERTRITRGLVDWLGFSRDTVEFVAPPRFAGTASYGFFKLVNLAFHSFISHSFVPLKLAGYMGLAIMVISGPLGLFVFVNKYILSNYYYNFTGPAALAVIILFLIGIVLSCLGLIALYIANIHTEVAGRPMYVIRKTNVTKTR